MIILLKLTKGANKIMYCYRRIRDLREDFDKNQTVIAEYLEITQQTYSLYERGDREIPLHLMIRLADYYGVTMDYICDRQLKKKAQA